MESSGGGGFGDPLERDPEAVARDVAEGLVTASRAEACYGVALREGAPDGAATRERRARLAGVRPRLVLRGLPDSDGGRCRVLRLGRGAAVRLGVEDGAVVELVSVRGAPIRAWVEVTPDRAADEGGLAAEALAALGVRDGESAEIRVIRPASS
jgi:N-methylhydantoinase B